MRRLLIVAALALLGADDAPTGGAIAGRVSVIRDRTTVSRDDVYVYLEQVKRPRGSRQLAGEGQRREIRQLQQRFVPGVLVVATGTVVAFPNFDREEHNVFSPTDPPFDLGRYKTDKRGKTHKFEDADEFDIYCDIHRDMHATVKVVDTPYFERVTGGSFAFHNVAAGTYKVVAWVADSAEVKSDPITVAAGETVRVPVDLHLQLTVGSSCHNRADGTPYDKYAPCPGAR